MSKEFTYIIRSDSRNSTTYADANSFTLKLANLPTHYKLFDCEVVGCYITDKATEKTSITLYAEVQCDNIDIYDEYDTRNFAHRVLASNIGTFGGHPMKYRIGNFNNREVNFRVVDSNNSLLTIHAFIVILKLTGVEE
jgi:hypothetical protein